MIRVRWSLSKFPSVSSTKYEIIKDSLFDFYYFETWGDVSSEDELLALMVFRNFDCEVVFKPGPGPMVTIVRYHDDRGVQRLRCFYGGAKH